MPGVAERRKHQMPAYVLSNLAGDIARNRKRLEQLPPVPAVGAVDDLGELEPVGEPIPGQLGLEL